MRFFFYNLGENQYSEYDGKSPWGESGDWGGGGMPWPAPEGCCHLAKVMALWGSSSRLLTVLFFLRKLGKLPDFLSLTQIKSKEQARKRKRP